MIDNMFEVVVGGFIITNTLAQLYDIVWCRWHHCGKSSKNSVEEKEVPLSTFNASESQEKINNG